MKTISRLVVVIGLLCMLATAQYTRKEQDTATVSTSGSTATFTDSIGGANQTFEYIIGGAPATVSIVLQGCQRGGTCDTLDTYTTVANSNRIVQGGYDVYKVTPTWTGGASPSVIINRTSTVSRKGSPALTASGVGYTFAIWNTDWPIPGTTVSAQMNGTNNQIVCDLHVQDQTQLVGRVTVNVTAFQAASAGDVGWYDINGNLLTHTAGFATTANGALRTALTNTYTLQANVAYYFCQVNSVALTQVTVMNSSATVPIVFINQGTNKRSVTAANAAVAGVMPATLGALTAQSSVSPVVALFEP